MKRQPGTLGDAEQIVCAAVTAFGRGAKSMRVAPPAVESVRRTFIPQIASALESPEWQAEWRRVQGHVRAHAEAARHPAQGLGAQGKPNKRTPAGGDAAHPQQR